MRFPSWSSLAASLAALSAVVAPSTALVIRESPQGKGIVQFDNHSILVKGQRVILYSGEFHPYRQAVPGLRLDIFQKMRSLGFTAASCYIDWALLEGKPGNFLMEGVLDITTFLDAAQQAGIYIIARPGPYINGETAGGGIPGWVQRVPGAPRTRFPLHPKLGPNQILGNYQNASMNYWTSISKVLAAQQVNNGGPVIMVQIENEYVFTGDLTYDPQYLQNYENAARAAGLVVPFSYNDVTPPQANGRFAYGQGKGSVEVYGQDSYPLSFSCNNPTAWGDGLGFPTDYADLHAQQSPATPMAILEYQGGYISGWGDEGYENCAELVNGSGERLLSAAAVNFVTTVQNIYMVYGGTNWGNSGQPYGYTSYDYGAAITENRTITREKFWQGKLINTQITSNLEYVSAFYQDNSNQVGQYTPNQDIAVSQAYNNATGMRLFVIRHSDYTTYDVTPYNVTLPTSLGNTTIPQTISNVVLTGRDAKIHTVDYNIENNVSIWYSTPDVFAFNADSSKSVLVVYGGYGEPQELAFSSTNLSKPKTVVGSGITSKTIKGRTVLSWKDQSAMRVVDLGQVIVYIFDRGGAANLWRLQVSSASNPPYTNPSAPSVLMNGGYLMRTAGISGTTLSIVGDVNTTTPIEIFAGMPSGMTTLNYNGQNLAYTKSSYGSIKATIKYKVPKISLPNMGGLTWHYTNALPELVPGYDDSAWPVANIKKSPNDEFQQGTPVSLSGSDYGFNTGSLIFRGHFNATGKEQYWAVDTAGGLAYSTQCWFNDQYVGYWAGNPYDLSRSDNYTLPTLTPGPTVITMVIDHMGMDEQPHVGNTQFKLYRGIQNYTLDGHKNTDITWKLTGNYLGEDYPDKSRGPLNEGGTWPSRHGYHLPSAPVSNWPTSSPTIGLDVVGARFYYASFDLNLPKGYEIPISLVFGNGNTTPNSYWRCYFYINGWNFGKYVNNVGPQYSFPIPQGVLDYNGKNYIALELWAENPTGDSLSIEMINGTPIQTGYAAPALVNGTTYTPRPNAY